MDHEQPLSGGTMSSVVRVGDTVRRTAGPWSPRVHELLARLRAAGITEAPAPIGFDEHGREVLSYLRGTTGTDPLQESLRGDEIVRAAARLLRRVHDASADVALARRDGWRLAAREPIETICHGDFAPYNCVFDGAALVGVIDFDHAHPAPRLWDVAYALYRFAPLMHPANPDGFGVIDEQARRARLFCDEYDLERRTGVIDAVVERLDELCVMLRRGAARGDLRLRANIDAGHLALYERDRAYLADNRERLESAIEVAGSMTNARTAIAASSPTTTGSHAVNSE